MKLYWGPHTCAIGIHVLLEEIGKPFELEKYDVMGGETHKEPFKTVNPKEKVPVLRRDDGSTLTEFAAIATWLARTNPERQLIPSRLEDEVRALEIMDFAVGTLHGQAFGRIFMPVKFEPKDLLHKAGLGQSTVREEGREMVEAAFAILDNALGGKPYAGGDAFSIADAALFYAERWAPQVDIDLPSNIAAHFQRMRSRPSVRRALEAEGETA